LGSATEGDFGTLCKFQVVAIIDSPCWSQASAPAHTICTNNTNEEGRIMAISGKLKQQCPGVSTQMYLNSLMDFYWYDLHKEFEGTNATQLLHDIHGKSVNVNQDGGAQCSFLEHRLFVFACRGNYDCDGKPVDRIG
jgi:hypothetical protein